MCEKKYRKQSITFTEKQGGKGVSVRCLSELEVIYTPTK